MHHSPAQHHLIPRSSVTSDTLRLWPPPVLSVLAAATEDSTYTETCLKVTKSSPAVSPNHQRHHFFFPPKLLTSPKTFCNAPPLHNRSTPVTAHINIQSSVSMKEIVYTNALEYLTTHIWQTKSIFCCKIQ